MKYWNSNYWKFEVLEFELSELELEIKQLFVINSIFKYFQSWYSNHCIPTIYTFFSIFNFTALSTNLCRPSFYTILFTPFLSILLVVIYFDIIFISDNNLFYISPHWALFRLLFHPNRFKSKLLMNGKNWWKCKSQIVSSITW